MVFKNLCVLHCTIDKSSLSIRRVKKAVFRLELISSCPNLNHNIKTNVRNCGATFNRLLFEVCSTMHSWIELEEFYFGKHMTFLGTGVNDILYSYVGQLNFTNKFFIIIQIFRKVFGLRVQVTWYFVVTLINQSITCYIWSTCFRIGHYRYELNLNYSVLLLQIW